MVTNFTGFARLGTVLVAMLGIGIAEGSGFIGTALRLLILSALKSPLTFVIVFAGILSNMASEIGYICRCPWGALFFWSMEVIPSPDWQPHSLGCLEVRAQICCLVSSIPCWPTFPKKRQISSFQGI